MTDINNRVTMLDILSQLSTTNNTVIEVKNTVDNIVNPPVPKVANIIKVGDIVEENGILSGFSNSNYATLPEVFNPNGQYWEICMKFKVFSNDEYSILCNYHNEASINFYVLYRTFNNDNRLLIECPVYRNGSCSCAMSTIDISYGVPLNSYIWVKYCYSYIESKSRNGYSLYVSNDGEEWNLLTHDTYISAPGQIGADNEPLRLGTGPNGWTTKYKPLDGEIDLTGCYIKIGDTMWWEGMTAQAE